MRTLRSALMAGVLGLTAIVCQRAVGATVSYTDETTFKNAISPGYALETFSSFTNAAPLGTTYGPVTVNGFSATYGDPNGLWSAPGVMTTNGDQDMLTVTFSPNVTAVGGNFYETDINGGLLNGYYIFVTLTDVNDNQTFDVYNSADRLFSGFTSTVPIKSLSIFAPTEVLSIWPAIDFLYYGAAAGEVDPGPSSVPLPASVWGGVGLMGLLGVARGRKVVGAWIR